MLWWLCAVAWGQARLCPLSRRRRARRSCVHSSEQRPATCESARAGRDTRAVRRGSDTLLRLIYFYDHFTTERTPSSIRLGRSKAEQGHQGPHAPGPAWPPRSHPRRRRLQYCISIWCGALAPIAAQFPPNRRRDCRPIATYARATSRLLSPGQHVLGGRGRRELGGEVRVLERLLRVRVRARVRARVGVKGGSRSRSRPAPAAP